MSTSDILTPLPAVEHQPGIIRMIIDIDATNSFGRLSLNDPKEATERTDEDDDENSVELADEAGELAVPQIQTRQLQRGWSAQKGAESIYIQTLSGCSFNPSDQMKKIPKFGADEIMMGLVLGSGAFGAVYEVRGFHLNDAPGILHQPRNRPRRSNEADEEVTPGEIESRNFIAKHCYRNNGDARYAVKKLRANILEDDSNFMNGMADLANETLYLSSLRSHPNIIKLRGIASANMFSKDYFLVLDRLYDTLQVRILKWRKQKNKSKGIRRVLKDRNGIKKRQLLETRMQYAMDLVAAIAYIHEHRIIHRDLKPDNIGFDVRNDIKVFDFGLAREMPPPKTNSPDELFNFSMAGSPRYMAPEVGLELGHNQSCDIYSFALIFWEMMCLKRPYPNLKNVDQLAKNVWAPWGPKQRPLVPAKMDQSLQDILHESWSHDHAARPKAPVLLERLKKECLKLRQDMRISHTARRSTYVLSERGGSQRGSNSQELKLRDFRNFMQRASQLPSEMTIQSATQFDSALFEGTERENTESTW